MLATDKKPRRKFRFKSREDAEAAQQRADDERQRTYHGLNAVVNGEVEWLPAHYGDVLSWYRLGIVKMRWTTLVLVSYHAPHCGQRTSTAVYSEDWPQQEIRAQSIIQPSDELASAYRDGVYEVARKVRESFG